MAMFKPIFDHEIAARRFLSDLGNNDIVTYDIPDFTADAIPSVYPAGYLGKCTHATVALSGSNECDYMIVCPYRIDRDRSNQRMVYDIDPMIITLDSINNTPSPVAVVGYHQDFPGRTTPIMEFSYSDIHTTVAQIRPQIITSGSELSSIPMPVENSLHHMARYFQQNYGL